MRRETFETTGPLTLDLRMPAGEVELESVDGDQTTVELSSPSDGDSAREVIERTRIELRSRGEGDEHHQTTMTANPTSRAGVLGRPSVAKR